MSVSVPMFGVAYPASRGATHKTCR
jgi:hypothetical protein